MTVTGEVTNLSTGITFLRSWAPSVIIQVASVALGGSEAFPVVSRGLSGAGSLFVTSNEFVGLSFSLRGQTAKNGGSKIDLATCLFGKG